MAEGSVASIHLASKAMEPMREVEEVRAVPGRGLEGDRYFRALGTFSDSPDTELTLIEAEAVEALAAEHGLILDPGEARRNVVTRGVELPAHEAVPHRRGTRARRSTGGALRPPGAAGRRGGAPGADPQGRPAGGDSRGGSTEGR